MSLNIQTDKFVYRSDLETTITAYFPSISLNYTAINLFLQKLSTLINAKFTISTTTDFTLQTSVKYLRAIAMCSAFTPDCGHDNSTIILIVDLYCPNTGCLGELCLHRRLFNLSAESIINVRKARLCAKCAILLFEIRQNPFSCRLAKGFTFLKRVQKQFQLLLEMSFVLASIVRTERKANLSAVM